MSSIRIQSRKDSALFTTAKEPPADAFTNEEIGYLSNALGATFAQAGPNDWIVFGLNRVLPSGVTEVTTGGWYADKARVHLVLANYRHAVTKVSVQERIWQEPWRADAEPFYAVVPAEHVTVAKAEGLLAGLFGREGPEILIAHQALLKATTLGATPSPPVVVPAPLSQGATADAPPVLQESVPKLPIGAVAERLRALKQLREEGLITEEEYREKKKALLDRF